MSHVARRAAILGALVGTLLPIASLYPAWASAGADAHLPLAPPEQIRIGLQSDLEEWVVACCDATLASVDGSETWRLRARASIRSELGSQSAGSFRVQVAALRDDAQAQEMAAKLGREFGVDSSVAFDATAGLFKVRLGDFVQREPAEVLRDGLALRGYEGAWVVSEASLAETIGFVVATRDGRKVFTGRWLRILRDSLHRVSGTDYRGSLLLFLNDRGRINVINELAFEDYLRGVVPKELGPASHPYLEALKAQAIAARTYALSHLGSFAGEGYDLCATPRCQVYGGHSVEHPLSDRAVEETQSEVLWFDDSLAETLYSASCGGHTEDIQRVFPRRSGRHLVGVPCVEGGAHRLPAGIVDRSLPVHLLSQLATGLGLPAMTATASLEPRPWIDALALAAGSDPQAITSSTAEHPGRRIREVLDLFLPARLLAASATETVELLISRAASELRQPTPVDNGEELSLRQTQLLILGLALETQQLEVSEAHHLALGPGNWLVREHASSFFSESRATNQSTLALFDRGRAQSLREARLIPGDHLRLLSVAGVVVAALVPSQQRAAPEVEPQPAWRRYRSDTQLAEQVSHRVPGLELVGLEVLARGASGRVTELRLQDRSGEDATLRGLVIRWTLDVPDTLFSMQRIEEGSRRGYVFRGRGRGHGVGMCQLGAVAMARSGHVYRQILGHYYGGAQVKKLGLSSAMQSTSAASETLR